MLTSLLQITLMAKVKNRMMRRMEKTKTKKKRKRRRRKRERKKRRRSRNPIKL